LNGESDDCPDIQGSILAVGGIFCCAARSKTLGSSLRVGECRTPFMRGGEAGGLAIDAQGLAFQKHAAAAPTDIATRPGRG
jgi:hypothetical protein